MCGFNVNDKDVKHQQLPLTPPSTVKKESRVTKKRTEKVVPKKLVLQLTKAARKSRLKYKPALNEVFNIDEYLLKRASTSDGNVLHDDNMDDNEVFLEHVLLQSKKIVVVAGAGISVEAGIPDFRSSDGLFTMLKSKSNKIASGKELFDFNRVYSSDEMSKQFNLMIKKLHHLSKNSVPTDFHKYLNELSKSGRLLRVYTQNIDGLETRLSHLSAKIPLGFSKNDACPNIIQLHGSIHHMQCNKCRKVSGMEPTIFNVEDEETELSGKIEYVPSCKECMEFEEVRKVAGLRAQGVGKMRPRIVLYNEVHPEGDIISEVANMDMKKKPDCLIIAGTSLNIPGVKSMCKQFITKIRTSKGYVIYVNKELPSKSILDAIGGVDLIVLGDCQNIPKIFN
ncbi:hypothetical protein TPHA_0L00930 [Tetrapisispora phaffii CBS 4417]|uniref:Deacetylase sirtuin-type domain-containing protein n=1 Tax=Tetrapisispora phaffii (strain ATCC 24235 / CBS 4417 / NBRC 1672 / NRRL Y-8282 / UCD 70-5) TaxID=1071381 RepID=G8BZX2_TETPH|nr:hypothetical protein TPHA_0L00930 [Tetrapisispora phaffii CBS 4417]CCE65450.1 hypothetical protein TPHA_0L00930 [Tetrapisispora phaffii CBS 4417]